MLELQANTTVVDYLSDVAIADAIVGVLASGCVIVIALSLGGFSFFVPWMISATAVLLATGFLRARSEGNIWLKSVVISLASLLCAAFFGNIPMVGSSVPFLILPCVCGIWVSRRRRSVTAGNE
jgi:hypothetical protein